MKKFLLKFSIVAVLIVTLSSCDEDTVIFNGTDSDALAAFSSSTGSFPVVDETSTTTVVVNVSDLSPNDRTIVISVDSTSTILPAEYEIVASTLVVPANSYQGEIQIKGNFEALPDGIAKKLNLKLESVGDAFVSPSLFSLSIFKSCQIDLTGFPLTYNVEVYAFGEQAPSHVQTLTVLTTGENTFRATSMWGPNFVAWATNDPSYEGQFLYPANIVINCDNTVDVITTGTQFLGGSGTYDPSSGVIDVTITQGVFSSPFDTQVIFIPN